MPFRRVIFRSDRKSTRLNSSHTIISYAAFCLKKTKGGKRGRLRGRTRGTRSFVPRFLRCGARSGERDQVGVRVFPEFFFEVWGDHHPLPFPPTGGSPV